MQIHVNGDNKIHARAPLAGRIETSIESSLKRFGRRITRVEVHLADENGSKQGPADKRCTIEAHMNGVRSTAVSHRAETLEQAVEGATNKLERAIDHTLGRLRDH